MEEAAELSNYLPRSFKSPKEQEYIEFLWDAFETNYTHGKHQFAFLADMNAKSRQAWEAERDRIEAAESLNAVGQAIQVASATREMVKAGKPSTRRGNQKPSVFRGSADDCAYLRRVQVPEAGVEPALDVTPTGF